MIFRYSESCATRTIIDIRFSWSLKETPYLLAVTLTFSQHLQLLVATDLLSVSTDLSFLDILHKWNHITWGLLWLFSFTWHAFKMHSCCSMYQNVSPFKWLIIFHCRCTIFLLLIHQLMDIWAVSTLGPLWIMLIWTFVYKFLCGNVFSSLRYTPKSGTGDCWVIW